MEPEGLIPHSQCSIINLPWAESLKFFLLTPSSPKCIIILSLHPSQGLPKLLFPVDLTVIILKGPYLLPFCLHALSILILHI